MYRIRLQIISPKATTAGTRPLTAAMDALIKLRGELAQIEPDVFDTAFKGNK